MWRLKVRFRVIGSFKFKVWLKIRVIVSAKSRCGFRLVLGFAGRFCVRL